MLRKFILLAPDPVQGGDPAPQPNPNPEPTPNPNPDPPAPPPVGKIVVEGQKSERELELEATLENERAGRKKDQTRLCELEDENHRLKKIPSDRPKTKAKGTSGPMARFFGWEDED